MNILCLDYGSRYVGVAYCGEDGISLRHGVIDQKRQDVLDEVKMIVAEEKVKKIIIGVPLNLQGEETAQTHVSLKFIEKLRERLGETVEIEGADETLTSKEAARQIQFEGGKKEDEHAEAARLMLESYLNGRG